MIVFDLSCDKGHRFEGWFKSSEDFSTQCTSGMLMCPSCGSADVGKAPMAPAVGKKSNQQANTAQPARGDLPQEVPANPVSNAPMPPEVEKALVKLAEAQAKALKNSKWVGKNFAEQSRKMHYGEASHEVIHGEASPQEAQDLLDEGVPVAPLPFPVAPPEDLN